MTGEDLGDLKKELFGKDFKWGVSTAAYQIEGANDCDDKGPSIWDVFTAKKGMILNDDTAATACDFYCTYYKDIQLMKSLNIPNFRFSFSWSRILPTGTGAISNTGIEYYNKVIDACLEAGIEPWATLYHWDLPQSLEDKGGWTNRLVSEWFKEFAGVCAKHFGDRVKYWMVMNEPMVFTGAGHFMGVHAPGRKGLKNFLPAVHHAALSIAEGGRVLRSMLPDAEIGTTFSASYVEPLSMNPKDIAAAYRADVLLNRLFIEPILGMGYPEKDLPVLKKLRKYFEPGDESLMAFDFDFIGVQSYTREIIKYSLFVPYLNAAIVKAMFRKVPLTTMGWEVYPPSLYQVLKKFNEYEGIKKIYVTENGAAFPDTLANGGVNDPERVKYLQDHIAEVLKAKQAGMKVEGYFVWTLMDNFEWAEGYHPRFGLVHVDFATQQRTIKSSGNWYKKFLG